MPAYSPSVCFSSPICSLAPLSTGLRSAATPSDISVYSWTVFPTCPWDRLGFEQSTFLSFNLDSLLCFFSFIFFDVIWEFWGLKFIAVKLHKDWVVVTIHTWFSLKPVLHHNSWWLFFSFWWSHFVGRCLLQPYNFTEQHLRQVNDECVFVCCVSVNTLYLKSKVNLSVIKQSILISLLCVSLNWNIGQVFFVVVQ